MPENDTKDLETSSLASLEAVTSGRTKSVGSTASTQENHNCDRSVDVDATPPLGIKLTVYRLLNITTILSFCIAKGVLSREGLSTIPTALYWVSGGVLAVVLYWVGLYEGRDSKKLEWFFQVDLAPAIGYFSKRVVGGTLWILFFKNLFIISLDSSMCGLLGGVFLSHFSYVSGGGKLGVILGLFVLLIVFQSCLDALTQQVRAQPWASQWARDLMDDYGPGAPLVEQYRWFGVVGTMVGIIFGIAVAGLTVAVVYSIYSLTQTYPPTPLHKD